MAQRNPDPVEYATITVKPYKLTPKYVKCWSEYSEKEQIQTLAMKAVEKDIKCISAIAEQLRWVVVDIKDRYLEEAAQEKFLWKVYEDMLRSLLVQLRWICEDPLVELENRMHPNHLQAKFSLNWDPTNENHAWDHADIFEDEVFEDGKTAPTDLTSDPKTATDTKTFSDAIMAAWHAVKLTRQALKEFYEKLKQKVPELMSIKDMRSSPIPTRTAHDLMAQNAFAFNMSNSPNNFTDEDMKGWRKLSNNTDIKYRLGFHFRNRKWESDFNDNIQHPQAGVPTCIFVCAHRDVSGRSKWIGAATSPLTGQNKTKFHFAESVWDNVRDQGFGTTLISAFKTAHDNLIAEDISVKDKFPTLGSSSQRWLVLLRTVQANNGVSRAGRGDRGIAFNRSMKIMAPCFRCQGMTRYGTIPSFLTPKFLQDEIGKYNIKREGHKSAHQCAECFAYILCTASDKVEH
ncbi:hypothetical protein EKO04_005660 [Ascochyta lentis]|uniref:Uncharacterized protein n=1 Tax=Ascochyta lentis TaxID=205686 RepID=A0A8H7J5E3_9PLEO|nr:hypothetical protein EKO04_005660 [Ascochyta lentis]